MKVAIYNSKRASKEEIDSVHRSLESAGFTVSFLRHREDLAPDTDYVVAIGGDGTFLAAAGIVSDLEIPLVGVNCG